VTGDCESETTGRRKFHRELEWFSAIEFDLCEP